MKSLACVEGAERGGKRGKIIREREVQEEGRRVQFTGGPSGLFEAVTSQHAI